MLFLSPFITVYILILTAVMGAVFGSFLNCLAYRLVHGGSILKGRSKCPKCGHELSAPDLVPIFSYLFLKGKCRYCKAGISARYPISEVVCAVIWVCTVLRFDITLEMLMYLILMNICFCLTITDLDDMIIPDSLLLVGALLFIPLSLLVGGWQLLVRGLFGAAVMYIPMLLIVLLIEKVLGKEAMGGGDLKLMALLGLYLGWELGLMCLIFACFIGIIMGLITGKMKERAAFPFGPSLAISAFITALVGRMLLDWYLSLFMF